MWVADQWEDYEVIDTSGGEKLKLEKFIAWYFGCTEEEAADYIPDMQEDDFPEEE